MSHTPQPEPQFLDWTTIRSRVASHVASRLTNDAINEIRYAFYLISQNQVRVVTDPTPTVQPEQENYHDNHTDL
jgi:GH18 family chitinase